MKLLSLKWKSAFRIPLPEVESCFGSALRFLDLNAINQNADDLFVIRPGKQCR
jgi:hypothetical protein